MNKIFESAILFVSGVAVGFIPTYIWAKKQIAERNEAIQETREIYQKMKDKVYEKPSPDKLAEKYKKEPVNDILNKYGKEDKDESYIDLTRARQEMEARNSVKEALKERIDIPYEISEEEFGEFDDYTPISLTYYADGIVADERDVPMEDMERLIGSEWQNGFDSVCYIRNDALKCDYEITEDLRKYSDVLDEAPYLRSEL